MRKQHLSLALIGTVSVLLSCDYKPKNQGRALYVQHCQSCHMEKGQGLGELYPPVANSDYVQNRADELACIIRHGIEGPIVVNGVSYSGNMAGYPQLTENEISNLVYFITKEFNRVESPYSLKDVKKQLSGCPITPD